VSGIELGFAALSVLAGALVKGVAGLGLPLVAMPLLSWLVGLKHAVALLVVPMFASNFVQSFQGGLFVRNLRNCRVLALTVFVFSLIGTRLLVTIPERPLALAVGVMLIVLPLAMRLRPAAAIGARGRRWADPLVGACAGLLGGIAAYYGPPLMIYVLGLRLSKNEFVSMISLLYWIGAAGILLGIYGVGAAPLPFLGLSALMLVPTGAGMWLGQRFRLRLGEAAFANLLAGIYLATGASFLLRAAL
jgi:uncharacterized membrane protein YfcA